MNQETDRLTPIRNEQDLELYRRFLETDTAESAKKTAKRSTQNVRVSTAPTQPGQPPVPREQAASLNSVPDFLRQHLGQVVRAEFLIGGRLYVRAGVLAQADADFLVLRRCDGSLTVCTTDSVKFVTVIPQRERHRC